MDIFSRRIPYNTLQLRVIFEMEKSEEIADTYSRVKDSSELLGSYIIEPIAVLVLVCLVPLVGFLLFHLYMCFQAKCGAGSKKVRSFKILSNVLLFKTMNIIRRKILEIMALEHHIWMQVASSLIT